MELEGRVEAGGEGERGYAGGFGGAGGEEVFGDMEGEGRGGHFGVVGRVVGRGVGNRVVLVAEGFEPYPTIKCGLRMSEIGQ